MSRSGGVGLGVLVGLVGAAVMAPEAAAQRMPVAPQLQGAILSKVLRFDRTLQEQGVDPLVLIAYDGRRPEVAGELVAAFEQAGVAAEPVELAALGDRVAAHTVIYVSPGVDPGELIALCERAGALSVTGVPSWVREGLVAVGVASKEGRPTILVHLPRMRATGHRLAADLLALAEVIR